MEGKGKSIKKMKLIDKKINGKIYGILFIYWKFVNFKNRYVFE